MHTPENRRFTAGLLTGLVLAAALALAAAPSLARGGGGGGRVVVEYTTVDEAVDVKAVILADDTGVFAAFTDPETKEDVELPVRGGRGLVAAGVLADGDAVRLTGRSRGDRNKREEYYGHVTVVR